MPSDAQSVTKRATDAGVAGHAVAPFSSHHLTNIGASRSRACASAASSGWVIAWLCATPHEDCPCAGADRQAERAFASCEGSNRFRSRCVRWTSSVAPAGGSARSRARLLSPRSRKRLPQHDCNQAGERERYQIGGHRLSTKKKMRGRSRDEAAIVSGANPISVSPETAAARATGPAPRAGTFARARPEMVRTAARRSAPLERGLASAWPDARPPSDLEVETKKPAADASGAGEPNSSR